MFSPIHFEVAPAALAQACQQMLNDDCRPRMHILTGLP
jgi:hypothetical protein